MTIQIYVMNTQNKTRSLTDFHFNPKQLLGFWVDDISGPKGVSDIIFYLPGVTLATPYSALKVASFIEILNINADKK